MLSAVVWYCIVLSCTVFLFVAGVVGPLQISRDSCRRGAITAVCSSVVLVLPVLVVLVPSIGDNQRRACPSSPLNVLVPCMIILTLSQDYQYHIDQ